MRLDAEDAPRTRWQSERENRRSRHRRKPKFTRAMPTATTKSDLGKSKIHKVGRENMETEIKRTTPFYKYESRWANIVAYFYLLGWFDIQWIFQALPFGHYKTNSTRTIQKPNLFKNNNNNIIIIIIIINHSMVNLSISSVTLQVHVHTHRHLVERLISFF